MSEQDYQAGLTIRKQVMGEAHVEKSMGKVSDFAMPVQDWINENGWGSTWQREGLDKATRSLVTVAMLTALRAPNELKGHIKGALNNGCTPEQIREVLLHSAVYCGAPALQEAFRAAEDVEELMKHFK